MDNTKNVSNVQGWLLLTFGDHHFSESTDNERTDNSLSHRNVVFYLSRCGGKVYLPCGKLSRIFCLMWFPRDNRWVETNIEQERGSWVLVLSPPLPKLLTFAVSESLLFLLL